VSELSVPDGLGGGLSCLSGAEAGVELAGEEMGEAEEEEEGDQREEADEEEGRDCACCCCRGCAETESLRWRFSSVSLSESVEFPAEGAPDTGAASDIAGLPIVTCGDAISRSGGYCAPRTEATCFTVPGTVLLRFFERKLSPLRGFCCTASLPARELELEPDEGEPVEELAAPSLDSRESKELIHEDIH